MSSDENARNTFTFIERPEVLRKLRLIPLYLMQEHRRSKSLKAPVTELLQSNRKIGLIQRAASTPPHEPATEGVHDVTETPSKQVNFDNFPIFD